MVIYAKFMYPHYGYTYDQKKVENNNLLVDNFYPVSNVSMGQSHTSIFLDGYKDSFNSVHFEFYDENMKKIDLRNTVWNPYVNIEKNNKTPPRNRKKYEKGERLKKFDKLFDQEFIYFNDKIYHNGWVLGWQLRFAKKAFDIGLYKAVRKDGE